MKYINLLFILALLTSCATVDEPSGFQVEASNPRIQSENEISRYKKATHLLNQNKLDAAQDIFISLNEERPELAGPYANLAIIALKHNEPNIALELVNKAIVKNPNFAQALNLLAYLEQVKGDIKSAEIHYKKAIKNKPDYYLAYYNLALLYDIYLQDIGRAIPYYEKYMKLINNRDKTTADWLEQIKRTKENG